MLNKLVKLSRVKDLKRHEVISNTLWLLSEKVLRMGLGILVGVWVARYLGPSQFGLLNYATAFASIFNVVANLGLDGIVVRNIVREPSCKNEILGTAFTLKAIAQIIALLLATGIIVKLRPNEPFVYLLVFVTLIGMFFESFYVIDFWFQSQVQSKFTVLAKNIGLVIVSLGKVLLIKLQASLLPFTLVYSLETMLLAVGLLVIYRYQGNSLRAWRFSSNLAKRLLQDSWPLALSSFVIMIYMRTDQLMIGQIVNDQAVGIYSAAVRISELWYILPIAITSSIFPSLVKLRQVNTNQYYKQIQKVLDVLSILSFSAAILVLPLAHWLVNLLYGESYSEAASVLVIHIWTGVFVASGLARNMWTTAEGLTSFAFLSSLAGAVVNVILNYFLIKSYGGNGAAIATLIAQFIASYATSAFLPKAWTLFVKQTKALVLPSALIRLIFNQ